MSDSATRHRDAVTYNRVLAEAAEGLAKELTHPEVIGWVEGIARLHRYHERRHAGSLKRLEDKNGDETSAEKSIEEQQAEFAAEQEKSEASA